LLTSTIAGISEVLIGAGALVGAWFSYRHRRSSRSAYFWGYLLMGTAFLGFSIGHYSLFSGHKAVYRSIMIGATMIGGTAALLLVVGLLSDVLKKLRSGRQNTSR
jgi:predicted membrane protein